MLAVYATALQIALRIHFHINYCGMAWCIIVTFIVVTRYSDQDEIYSQNPDRLTHWGRVTHICVSKLTIIGSDNGLAPGRRQAIILTNAGIILIEPLGTNFSEILI